MWHYLLTKCTKLPPNCSIFPTFSWAEPLAGLRAFGARTRASVPHLSGLELPSRTWNFLHLQVLRSCNFFNWISNTAPKIIYISVFEILLVRSSEMSKNDSPTSGILAALVRRTTAYFWFSHKLQFGFIYFRQVNGTFGQVIFTTHLPDGHVHSIWNFEACIYLWKGYQSIDLSIGGQISISVISVVSICSTNDNIRNITILLCFFLMGSNLYIDINYKLGNTYPVVIIKRYHHFCRYSSQWWRYGNFRSVLDWLQCGWMLFCLPV